MQGKKVNSAFWLGVAALALSTSLIGGKASQANVNTLAQPQKLLERPQVPAIKQKKGLDQSPMLISQAVQQYDGRWVGTMNLTSDTCGVFIPNILLQQVTTDLTVSRTSNVDIELRATGGTRVFKGKNVGGIKASARFDAGIGSGVGTYFIFGRIGNLATVGYVYQADFGCQFVYQGQATIQGP